MKIMKKEVSDEMLQEVGHEIQAQKTSDEVPMRCPSLFLNLEYRIF